MEYRVAISNFHLTDSGIMFSPLDSKKLNSGINFLWSQEFNIKSVMSNYTVSKKKEISRWALAFSTINILAIFILFYNLNRINLFNQFMKLGTYLFFKSKVVKIKEK